jgi:heme O synthase-like polyprenyltransferase
MGLVINTLSAVILLASFLVNVVIYTVWLKRRTPQNIVIGGAAGAFPPLIGWAAATGQVALLPVLLFALVFLWTPPHFWALALFVRSDYAAAGVPMLPVVAGIKATRAQVLVYTVWLKPRTPQNIVIGGAAGAFPPLIGWVAATGQLAPLPLLLFAIIFLWTPPHFWALSLFVRSDYAAANVPMLPVVSGVASTRRHIALYTLPMAAAAVAPWPLGLTGPIYGVVAAALSAAFIVLSLPVLANRATDPAGMAPEKRLFGFSVLYLFALFAALVADRWLLA